MNKAAKILKKIMLSILLIIGLIVCFIFFKRENTSWKESIEVTKGTIINVDFTTSKRAYYGGHGLGFGGGGDKNSLKLKFKGIEYKHKTPYTPLSIKLYKGHFYIIYFDRTDMDKITFQFYKSLKDGTFEKIKPNVFPKSIATQNRWFDKRSTEAYKNDFPATLTAKIWQQLEINIPYYESDHNVSDELIERYKEKYITNRREE